MRKRALWLIVVLLAIVAVPGLTVAYNRGLLADDPSTPSSSTSAGVKAQIQSVTIGSDRKPIVTLKLTDEQGNPAKLADFSSRSFVIAKLEVDPVTGLSQYVNYITRQANGAKYTFQGTSKDPVLASATQATTDSGGAISELSPGNVQYKFGKALPEGYDVAATHVVGVYIANANRSKVANDTFEFVPNGSPVTVQRQVVKTESCNRCHDPLALHGGTRRSTDLCILCHTSQTTDPETGNTVDFKVMIHKIHRGKDLPTVTEGNPYLIVGYGQNVFNFGEIGWPQDVRNCQTCHTGAQGENWKTKPNRAACGSCHDKVNFATGANHPGGPQANDANCAVCHQPIGPEFGPSIAGAHTIPVNSKQLAGVNFEIVSVSNTAPGQNPTVVFNVKDDAGNVITPASMDSLSLVLAGPTTDYVNRWAENATSAPDAGNGNFSYTFKAAIPTTAAGTYAVGIQGYVNRTIQGVKDPIRDAGFNKVAYAAVTDAKPMPRKQVVSVDKCNECHQTLGSPAGISIHGGSRLNTEFCVLCHNPTLTDEAVRPADQMPPESVDFKRLIHRIHTGEEQSSPFIVYGYRGTRYDFSEILYPGDRRNCAKCHVNDSNLLPFTHQGISASLITQGGKLVQSIPPLTSTCTGCHDSAPAVAHAAVMTTVNGAESCLVCHNEGREFAVSKAHAR